MEEVAVTGSDGAQARHVRCGRTCCGPAGDCDARMKRRSTRTEPYGALSAQNFGLAEQGKLAAEICEKQG